MKHLALIFTLLIANSVLIVGPMNAQSFIWHLKKVEKGKGEITIHQDPTLNYIIDNYKPVVVKKDTVKHEEAVKVKVRVRKDSIMDKPKKPELNLRRKFVYKRDSLMTAVTGRKKIMADAQKVQGYRIQLFAGGNTRADRQQAEAIGRRAKRMFPNEPIYTHFYSPRWICRMGNYVSQEKASAVLRRVKAAGIKGACIVKGTITIRKDSEEAEQLLKRNAARHQENNTETDVSKNKEE